MWRFNKEIVACVASLVLVGCGGGSGSASTTSQNKLVEQNQQTSANNNTTKKDNLKSREVEDSSDTNSVKENLKSGKVGYYLDSEVKGLGFECGEFSGVTSSDGAFLFEDGKDCIFKLGEIEVKTISKDKLFGGVTIIEDDIKLARVLQTMDIDNNPKNGIDIEAPALECLGDKLPSSEDELDELVECLNSADIPDFVHRDYAVTVDEAQDHIRYTRESLIPVAKDLDISTVQDEAVEINIMAENPRSDMLYYKIINKPKHGRLSGKAPNLVYTPDSSFSGSDSFTYVASNRKFSSNQAQVNITINSDELSKVVPYTNTTINSTDDANTIKNSSNDINDTNMYVDGDNKVLVYKDAVISSNIDLTSKQIAQITKDIYSKFRDDFDFIFIVSNSKRATFTYSGLYFGVQNDTQNIGTKIYDYSSFYGSEGRLQGIIHFPSIEKLDRGPKLHELLHRWANSIIDVSINGKKTRHWGYNGFDRRGQIGGFDIDTLNVESGLMNSGGVFSAKRFSSNANGGDSLPYNNIELYLMGLISADEVGDIMLSENASYLKSQDDRVYFRASKMRRVSFTEYLQEKNLPQRAKNSKSSYRVLTVLLTNSTPSKDDIQKVSTIMSDFAKNGADNRPSTYNLYEATNGKLHLNISNLSDAIK